MPFAASAKVVLRHPKKPFPALLRPSSKITPCPIQDRGRKLAVPPLFCRLLTKRGLKGFPAEPRRCTGRTRPALLRKRNASTPVQAAAPRGIRQKLLSPFHQTGALWAENQWLLFLILALTG